MREPAISHARDFFCVGERARHRRAEADFHPLMRGILWRKIVSCAGKFQTCPTTALGEVDLWRCLRRPGIGSVIGSKDRVDLLSDEMEKRFKVESMPRWRIRRQIVFREPEQTHRRIEPPAVFRVVRPLIVLLQMDKPARGLDQAFEIIRVLRFRPQPEMLKDVVRLIVALFIPAAEEAEITGMLRDVVRRGIGRSAAHFLEEPGNSLAFVHEGRNLGSAEMTGNRARIVFRGRACARTATGGG